MRWAPAVQAWDDEQRAVGLAADTRRLRRYHVFSFADAHPGTTPDDITHGDVIAWFADQRWKPNTRRGYRASLRLFFAWAHQRGHVRQNPAAELSPVKVPRAVPRPAPNDIVDLALRHTSVRTRLAVMVLAFTGMRRGEAARLHTDQIEHDLTGWAVRVVGKGGHERVIPIDDSLARSLRALPRGFVFPGRIDGHLSPHYLGKIVSGALGEGWTAHTLRHRYASLAYSVERDIRAVQELLGHASVTTTQIYTYIPRENVRRAAAGARGGLTAA